MRILVVYASRSGSTVDLATWVADAARAAGHTVTLATAADAPDPDGFDAVIAGSGIRAGAWHADAVAWVTRHADALRRRPFATFTGSLRAADPSPASVDAVAAYTRKLLDPLDLTPDAAGSLVGAYDPTRVSLPERLLMRSLGQGRPQDQRDADAVRAWTVGVLDRWQTRT